MTTNDHPRHRPGRTGLPQDDPALADLLGLRRLPPTAAVRLGVRLRAVVARLHRQMAPPPARVLEAVLGSLDTAAVATLCRLDVPDRLGDGRSCTELATELGVDAARLERLLRYAAARGWVRIDRRGRVRKTRVSTFLRHDHPGGWRSWVEFAAGAECTAALGNLEAALPAGGDAFRHANGAPFFDWMSSHQDRHVTFDAAMAAGGRMHGALLARALHWSDGRRVCDVGGGDGSVLGVLLAEHPHLEATLLELPEVAERAPHRPGVTVISGDAFEAIPSGCDTYLFVNVLHDWDDAAAIRLLQCAADAARAAARPRIVVVESEAPKRPRDDLAVRADLLMLALTPGGRERTRQEVAALGRAAGLRVSGRHHLASGDVAYVLEPSTA